jgi:hypothetical protein
LLCSYAYHGKHKQTATTVVDILSDRYAVPFKPLSNIDSNAPNKPLSNILSDANFTPSSNIASDATNKRFQ